MTDVHHQRQRLRAADNHEIHVQTWEPGGEVSVVIQVLHGLGEHSDRYARFAATAVQRGFAVCVHDHRGHGDASPHPGYFAASEGWHAVVGDARLVNRFVDETYAGRPIVLLGHSMGSFIAQSYAMNYGSELAGLVLSGSTFSSRPALLLAYILARFEAWRVGRHLHSPLLDKLGFGSQNKPFEPARTEFDWLSRDEAEVDKYIADPLCGGPYTAGLWVDFLGGLIEITSDNALQRIPAGLPLLITGGELDPIGGDKGMGKLLQHYAQTGHQRLKARIYPEGRHEMLNETNRAEATSDWLDWIATATRSAHSTGTERRLAI